MKIRVDHIIFFKKKNSGVWSLRSKKTKTKKPTPKKTPTTSSKAIDTTPKKVAKQTTISKNILEGEADPERTAQPAESQPTRKDSQSSIQVLADSSQKQQLKDSQPAQTSPETHPEADPIESHPEGDPNPPTQEQTDPVDTAADLLIDANHEMNTISSIHHAQPTAEDAPLIPQEDGSFQFED